MFSSDRFKIGDAVRIVRAAEAQLIGAVATIIEGRKWRTARSRMPGTDGYQLFAYAIKLPDGRTFCAEDHTLEPMKGGEKSWADQQRDEKVSWADVQEAIGWAPKNAARALIQRIWHTRHRRPKAA